MLGNGQSDMQLNISADGRFVSFVSSQDLIGDDPSGAYSLYFRSLQTGFLRRVFSSTTTLVAYSALSDNGEHMAYLYATFVPGAHAQHRCSLRCRSQCHDEVFSINSTNNVSYVGQGIGISGNGRYITFSLRSPTMVTARISPRSWRSTGTIQVANSLRVAAPLVSAMATAAGQRCRMTGM